MGCWALEPPKMQCIRLLNNNQSIKVSWSGSTDCIQFEVYYFYVNDNEVPSDSLFGTPSANLTLCNYVEKIIDNIPAPATSGPEYSCYIVAVDSNGNRFFSDTIQSISLTVTTNADNTQAYLEWTSPINTLDASWGNTFGIYKKRAFETDFPPQPFASVPNNQLFYTDTSDVCDNTISYQVGISNNYSEIYPCSFRTTIGTVHLVDSTSPTPPVLDSVSITPDNKVMLGFHETEPYMMGYIIYYAVYVPGYPTPEYHELDRVFGQTFWIDPVIDPSFDSRCYRIAAIDSCGNVSPMTSTPDKPQCNMITYLNGTDGCHRTASIHWTTYANLIDDIHHFDVLLSEDMGQTWEVVGTTTGTSYTIEGLDYNQDYLAKVRVVNNGATVTASSNQISFVITTEEAEDFTYIRSVSVVDNGYIQIKVLTSGDTLPFQSIILQRSEDGVNFETFKTSNYNPNSADYIFNDSMADFNRKTYYYRTFVINQCGAEVGQSNVSHNLLLHAENNAQNNTLTWYGYDNWDGDVENYYIMRKMESEELFATINMVPPFPMNTYNDDISSLYESGSKFVYYIEAKENTDQYGFEETSLSNQVTVIQPPTIYLANAFRPLGASNNIFRPVNSFVSHDGYRFSIFTRTGECVFMTTDPQEGWNGRFDGKLLPTSVYVWYLEYKLPDGTPMEQTGTVVLVK